MVSGSAWQERDRWSRALVPRMFGPHISGGEMVWHVVRAASGWREPGRPRCKGLKGQTHPGRLTSESLHD